MEGETREGYRDYPRPPPDLLTLLDGLTVRLDRIDNTLERQYSVLRHRLGASTDRLSDSKPSKAKKVSLCEREPDSSQWQEVNGLRPSKALEVQPSVEDLRSSDEEESDVRTDLDPDEGEQLEEPKSVVTSDRGIASLGDQSAAYTRKNGKERKSFGRDTKVRYNVVYFWCCCVYLCCVCYVLMPMVCKAKPSRKRAPVRKLTAKERVSVIAPRRSTLSAPRSRLSASKAVAGPSLSDVVCGCVSILISLLLLCPFVLSHHHSCFKAGVATTPPCPGRQYPRQAYVGPTSRDGGR
jgi:hypothetical protein